MVNAPGNDLHHHKCLSQPSVHRRKAGNRSKEALTILTLVMALLLVPLVSAQSDPTVKDIEPSSGKVNDVVTVTGDHLGKNIVSNVFLSDDTVDYKATVVDQKETQIVLKVPEVKPGTYNLSLQVGNKIYIKPVRFQVSQ